MAFSESPNIVYGGAQLGSPHHHQRSEKSPEEDQLASPMNKQSSILSLTLDEIKLRNGKSLGSMNMDEFLTNLWNNVDENQVSSSLLPNQNQNQNEPIIDTEPTLSRQNSFSIPAQLCKKTVEEVWSEIQKDLQLQQQQNLNHIANHEPPQRQPTFGEITLEEFLIKAGVVQEPTRKPCPPPLPQKLAPAVPVQNNNNTCLDLAYGMGPTCPMMALGFSTQPSMGTNMLVNGYAAYSIYTPTNKMVGELANNVENEDSSQGMLDPVGPKGNNRKRIIDGPHEVVVERRQRRMIKNRESAARSRARKQAYTVELELELTQLKEENDKLKETLRELERKGVQEILKRMKKQPRNVRKKSEKLRTLRRIASSTW